MRKTGQSGFSLIELLLVVLVIGLIASIAVPYLKKAVQNTENRNTRTSLRAVATTQLSYATTSGRYARLNEVNNIMGGGVGTLVGNEIIRGPFTLSMVPPNPTDAELKDGYTITAFRNIPGDGTYIYTLTENGRVEQISPFCTGQGCE